jgi:hypothetical protein
MKRLALLEESDFRYRVEGNRRNIKHLQATIDIYNNDIKTLEKAINVLMRMKYRMQEFNEEAE